MNAHRSFAGKWVAAFLIMVLLFATIGAGVFWVVSLL